eukprot:Nk52_evm4s571 gene=Nk52_evmTU4s571
MNIQDSIYHHGALRVLVVGLSSAAPLREDRFQSIFHSVESVATNTRIPIPQNTDPRAAAALKGTQQNNNNNNNNNNNPNHQTSSSNQQSSSSPSSSVTGAVAAASSSPSSSPSSPSQQRKRNPLSSSNQPTNQNQKQPTARSSSSSSSTNNNSNNNESSNPSVYPSPLDSSSAWDLRLHCIQSTSSSSCATSPCSSSSSSSSSYNGSTNSNPLDSWLELFQMHRRVSGLIGVLDCDAIARAGVDLHTAYDEIDTIRQRVVDSQWSGPPVAGTADKSNTNNTSSTKNNNNNNKNSLGSFLPLHTHVLACYPQGTQPPVIPQRLKERISLVEFVDEAGGKAGIDNTNINTNANATDNDNNNDNRDVEERKTGGVQPRRCPCCASLCCCFTFVPSAGKKGEDMLVKCLTGFAIRQMELLKRYAHQLEDNTGASSSSSASPAYQYFQQLPFETLAAVAAAAAAAAASSTPSASSYQGYTIGNANGQGAGGTGSSSASGASSAGGAGKIDASGNSESRLLKASSGMITNPARPGTGSAAARPGSASLPTSPPGGGASSLLGGLAKSVSVAAPAPPPPLDPAKLKKRGQARADKHLGDVYLMCASPAAALRYYQRALDQCRAQGDHLWAAGALEGMCAVLCFKRKECSHDTFDADILEKYSEAISFYLKAQDAETVAIEAMFKLSRILIEMRLNALAAYHLAGAISSLDCATSLVGGASALDQHYAAYGMMGGADVSPMLTGKHRLQAINIKLSEKIKVYACLAELFASIGLWRKWAFFVRLIAFTYLKWAHKQQALALQVLHECKMKNNAQSGSVGANDSQNSAEERQIHVNMSAMLHAGRQLLHSLLPSYGMGDYDEYTRRLHSKNPNEYSPIDNADQTNDYVKGESSSARAKCVTYPNQKLLQKLVRLSTNSSKGEDGRADGLVGAKKRGGKGGSSVSSEGAKEALEHEQMDIPTGWPTLQIKLLESLMTVGGSAAHGGTGKEDDKKAGTGSEALADAVSEWSEAGRAFNRNTPIDDALKVVEYASYYLHALHPHLSLAEQRKTQHLLSVNVRHVLGSAQMMMEDLPYGDEDTYRFLQWVSFPAVTAIQPLRCPTRLAPAPQKLGIGATNVAASAQTGKKDSNPFIYSPFSRTQALAERTREAIEKQIPIWVSNERFQVRVKLENPFRFGIEVESISLQCSSGRCDEDTGPQSDSDANATEDVYLHVDCFPSSTFVPSQCCAPAPTTMSVGPGPGRLHHGDAASNSGTPSGSRRGSTSTGTGVGGGSGGISGSDGSSSVGDGVDVIVEGRVDYSKSRFPSSGPSVAMLHIDGVVIRTFGNDSFHPVSKDMQSKTSVLVLPPLPLLTLSYQSASRSSLSADGVFSSSTSVISSALTLFEGQMYNGVLTMCSDSDNTLPIQRLVIAATDDAFATDSKSGKDRSGSSSDPSASDREKMILHLSRDEIVYGAHADILKSKTAGFSKAKCQQQLFIWPEGFNASQLVPFGVVTSTSDEGGGDGTSFDREEGERGGIRRVPVQLHAFSSRISRGLFRVEYGVDLVADHFRTAVLDIPVKVVPLLRIYNYDILAMDASLLGLPKGDAGNVHGREDLDMCLFCFDATNETRHPVSLSIDVDYEHMLKFAHPSSSSPASLAKIIEQFEELTGISNRNVHLEAFAVVRFLVPLPRVYLPPEVCHSMPPVEMARKRIVPVYEQSRAAIRYENPLFWYACLIKEVVALRWEMTTMRVKNDTSSYHHQLIPDSTCERPNSGAKHGQLGFDNLKLTPQLLPLLKRDEMYCNWSYQSPSNIKASQNQTEGTTEVQEKGLWEWTPLGASSARVKVGEAVRVRIRAGLTAAASDQVKRYMWNASREQREEGKTSLSKDESGNDSESVAENDDRSKRRLVLVFDVVRGVGNGGPGEGVLVGNNHDHHRQGSTHRGDDGLVLLNGQQTVRMDEFVGRIGESREGNEELRSDGDYRGKGVCEFDYTVVLVFLRAGEYCVEYVCEEEEEAEEEEEGGEEEEERKEEQEKSTRTKGAEPHQDGGRREDDKRTRGVMKGKVMGEVKKQTMMRKRVLHCCKTPLKFIVS